MVCESVQKGIRRGIVALTGLSNQRTRGRKNYEKIQRVLLKEAMKEPAACHLRPQDFRHRGSIELWQQPVLQHSRRMHHATDGRPAFLMEVLDESAHLLF